VVIFAIAQLSCFFYYFAIIECRVVNVCDDVDDRNQLYLGRTSGTSQFRRLQLHNRFTPECLSEILFLGQYDSFCVTDVINYHDVLSIEQRV